ncbi:MAG: N utilization substance protein B, partial [Hyphomicrobiales bacterium]|nr:N utilization substance protein B [Hyphomicrobiales bacterium]
MPAPADSSQNGNGARPLRSANRRGMARLAAVQALYQMEVAGTGLDEILEEFKSFRLGREIEGNAYRPADAAFFTDLVKGVVDQQRRIDPLIHNTLTPDWPLKRIDA